MRVHEVEDVAEDLEQLLGRAQLGEGALLLAVDEEVDELLVDGEEDVVLAGEVVVERRLGQAHGACDALHGGGGEALRLEQLGRGLDDVATSGIGTRLVHAGSSGLRDLWSVGRS
jgi:hypothetical protein